MLLGIDIGGTTISLGLVQGTNIVKKECVPSFRKDATLEETLEYLSDRIKEIITPAVTAMGVGVPTLVDPVRGIVYNAANIRSWTEVYLKDFLQDRFGVRAEVNNDANCYALGASARLGHPCHVTVGVTLGTGTGIGIVVDGKLMCGENCGSGELCSVPYLDSEYESYCSKKFFTAAGTDGRKAAAAAAAGDPATLQFFKEFGHHMGELLTLIMYAYDPGCIVLGGGIANTAPWFMDSMMETIRNRYIYPRSIDRLQIKVMPEDNVALLGASLL